MADVHRETGVSEPTLCAWRRRFQNRGEPVPADPRNPGPWSGRDKLAVVIETAALNEPALSAYCRRKGVYPEHSNEDIELLPAEDLHIVARLLPLAAKDEGWIAGQRAGQLCPALKAGKEVPIQRLA